ncbi:Serine/threonine-protein kinase PknK [Mycobacterium simulans]|uniref:Serine/threonine-protein kinase PknK n=1 Tax=Mycobacterium simulans TaxID=627089 RepID=A0A7Z7IM03_9MYCO|nr:protein kinase [Mycobacterium simulans]SOJ56053.1 Serine/threonine-protein kinase PknK [Mycobacterium simulans]
MMVERDPAPAVDVVAELAGAGFVDAVEIGRGGFGVVYRCAQVGLGRMVAVKVLIALSDQDRARFASEQQAMARLTGHPHIVAVLQVGQTVSGRPFLVMPLCAQGSWQDRIADQAVTLGLDEVLAVGAKMAGALAAAHRIGVVHRDVKPANILFTEYGEPALTDFAVAHIGAGFQTREVVVGTPAFAAPELVDGTPPDEASDVYGLGATLFAALTGHAVVERRHDEQVVAQFVPITRDPVPNPGGHDIPAEVAAIIAAAMAPDPADRPSAAELGEQLRHAQLRHPGAAGGSARPAASSATEARPTMGQLPALPGEVVGRESEVTQLQKLLTGSRLVTLTGVGGVGKTTLAIHAATQLLTHYPDGVWLIELAGLHDGALLTETVAAALGVRDQPGRTLGDVLLGILAQRHTLLILDNCEHLIDDVAKFVDTALRHCRRLHVLATSRGILDNAGETVMTVSPLAVPDPETDPELGSLAAYPGVVLFLQRASAAIPDFTLTTHNAAAVARICTRVEGLPLAIELAAARMRAMSAQQIADGLTNRYTLLTRGHRGAPTRHRTLAACIDWSYQLCTDTEQQLWAAFAVFAGSFDLPAAQHLCSGDLPANDVLPDLLGSLVDKSILIRTQHRDQVRFRLLETLRDYAKTHLSQSEQHRLRTRHTHWYHQLVTQARPQWFGHGQLYWSERLMREMANIREALQFALDHDSAIALEMAVAMRPIWLNTGMLGEARRWLKSALDATSDQPSALRIHALGDVAFIAFVQGDLAESCARVAEARDHLEGMDDAELNATIDCMEGYIAVQMGEIERAAECIRGALAGVVEPEVRWASLYYLGWVLAASGDLAQAVSCFETALEFSRSHGESIYQSRALVSVGMGHWLRGDPQRAEPVLIEGLRLSQFVGDPFNGAQCLEALAWTAGSRHDWRHAAVLMAAADAQSRAIGSPLLYVPDLISCHVQCDKQARQELGPEGFEAAWAEGAALNFDEAVALVLESYGVSTVARSGAQPS